MTDNENNADVAVEEESPLEEMESREETGEVTTDTPEKRFVPFCYGSAIGAVTDIVLLLILALISSQFYSLHEDVKVVSDYINGFVFWFAYPVGVGCYLILRKNKKWFGFGFLLSAYIALFMVLIIVVIVVLVAMLFGLA